MLHRFAKVLPWPALVAVGWWLGSRADQWNGGRVLANGGPLSHGGEHAQSTNPPQGGAVEAGDSGPAGFERMAAPDLAAAWHKIRNLEPLPENRWQALRFFRQWARADAEGALRELDRQNESATAPAAAEAPAEKANFSLWSPAEALRQFFMMLAETDPDKAWALAAKRQDPAALNAVAAALASRHPEAVLASGVTDDAVKLVAKARLAQPAKWIDAEDADDEARQLQMHRLLAQPLTAALIQEADEMIGGSEEAGEVLAWRQELASRIVERSPAAVTAALTGNSDSRIAGQILLYRAHTLSAPELLTPLYFGDQGRGSLYNRLRDSFDLSRELETGTLVSLALESAPVVPEGDFSFQSTALQELLSRDPMEAFSVYRLLASGSHSEKPPGIRVDQISLTPANAEAAKELIPALPADWRPGMLTLLLPVISEFDPQFAMDQIAASPGSGLQSADPFASSSDDHISFQAESVVSSWLNADTPAATAWIDAHRTFFCESGTRLWIVDLQDVLETWAGLNPEAASRWTRSLPAGELRDSAIKGIISAVTERDPVAAAAWEKTISAVGNGTGTGPGSDSTPKFFCPQTDGEVEPSPAR